MWNEFLEMLTHFFIILGGLGVVVFVIVSIMLFFDWLCTKAVSYVIVNALDSRHKELDKDEQDLKDSLTQYILNQTEITIAAKIKEHKSNDTTT